MKTIAIVFFALCAIGSAESADEIVRKTVPGFVAFDNGLDHTVEGRRKTALTNAECMLEHYMASEKVPEGVRISYALSKLKEQMRGCVFKEAARTNGEDFAFEVDQKGTTVLDDGTVRVSFAVDEEKTKIMRAELAKWIGILEQRLAEIYDPHKAEKGGRDAGDKSQQ